MTYGATITIIRLMRRYTQDYVAKQSGITQSFYSKIEKGTKRNVDAVLLGKIAAALGVSVEEIKNLALTASSLQNNDVSMIKSLTKQLKEKDAQIAELLALLDVKNKST